MKRTELFAKTLREAPSDETSRNAQLLIRAGFVSKEMAGVYSWLPLGLRVVENIKNIIREEMNAIGGQELLMSTLQNPDIWKKTGRWDDAVVDNWFKTKLKNGDELGLAFTHEEPIVNLASKYLKSYKDLTRPVAIYQFQNKLRNELRAKSGVMRGREFVMKDLYSFHATQADLDQYYEIVATAYARIFDHLGIGDRTFRTFASGGAFTEFSHEFQTICDAGEDWLYLDRAKNIAVNEEVLDASIKKFGLKPENLEKVRSAEVGNIFNFGDEKGRSMHALFTDENGDQKPLFLASYGIGVTRLVGVIAELFADDKGLVWPDSVAPFRVYLVNIGAEADTIESTRKLYDKLKSQNITVLWDDRDARPGEKFADAELMGLPHRVVVSPKTIAVDKIEYKVRRGDDAELLTSDELFKKLS
ncbi:MAG: aminoacyl--tRNA ligase-related protein [Candidatus Nanoperiomorbaceae bacterium]